MDPAATASALFEQDPAALEAGQRQPLLEEDRTNRRQEQQRNDLKTKFFLHGLEPVAIFLAFSFGPPINFDVGESLLYDVGSYFLIFMILLILMASLLLLGVAIFHNRAGQNDKAWNHLVDSIKILPMAYLLTMLFPDRISAFLSNGRTWFYAPLELYRDIHSPDVQLVCTNITDTLGTITEPLYQDGMSCGMLMNPFFLHWRPILWGLFSWTSMVLIGWNWSKIVRRFLPATTLRALWLYFLSVFPFLLIFVLADGFMKTTAIYRVVYFWLLDVFRRIHTEFSGASAPGGDSQPESIRPSDIAAVLLVAWWLALPWRKAGSIQSHLPLATDDMVSKVLQDKGFHAKIKKQKSGQLLRHASSFIIGGDVDTKSLEEKREHIMEDSRSDAKQKIPINETAPSTFLLREIRREYLLEDSLKSLKDKNTFELLAAGFQVSFKSESGIDAGGVTRDWFDGMAKMLSQGSDEKKGESLFRITSDGTLLPRNTGIGDDAQTVPDELKQRFADLFTAGRFLAVSVLRKFPLPLAFGTVLMKNVCGEEIDPRDVRRLDPDFYRVRVENIMREGGVAEMNAALGEPLTFMSAAEETVEPMELKAGGGKETVTEENKREYAMLLCEAHLCNGIRKELAMFLAGFHEVLSLDTLHANHVNHTDLSLLVSGIQTLDVQDWKQHSKFQANAMVLGSDIVLRWFWDVLAELSDEQKGRLLQFATGSSRVPPGGFKDIKPQFNVTVTMEPGAYLPHSHTCFNQLMLASYESKEQLRTKVIAAIDVGDIAGFGEA